MYTACSPSRVAATACLQQSCSDQHRIRIAEVCVGVEVDFTAPPHSQCRLRICLLCLGDVGNHHMMTTRSEAQMHSNARYAALAITIMSARCAMRFHVTAMATSGQLAAHVYPCDVLQSIEPSQEALFFSILPDERHEVCMQIAGALGVNDSDFRACIRHVPMVHLHPPRLGLSLPWPCQGNNGFRMTASNSGTSRLWNTQTSQRKR